MLIKTIKNKFIKYFTPPMKPASAITLGFAGRLTDPRKNASLLFQVIALVRKNGLDANLKITGETSPELNAEIKRQGLNKFVSFSGILNREGLRDFYQGLTVFIIPSYQEGLSIVGINYRDDGEKARRWLSLYGDPYDFTIVDANGDLGVELGVYGAPETFIVDANGIIRHRHVGDVNDGNWNREFLPILDSLTDG